MKRFEAEVTWAGKAGDLRMSDTSHEALLIRVAQLATKWQWKDYTVRVVEVV